MDKKQTSDGYLGSRTFTSYKGEEIIPTKMSQFVSAGRDHILIPIPRSIGLKKQDLRDNLWRHQTDREPASIIFNIQVTVPVLYDLRKVKY
jgi:hypothetical protein